ncbi:MAG: M23 family metallopeptidase [Leptospiraceae bacterium]|nr:M23 family metallopeptidase [Leptospiraceae bacterium]MDW7975728.1 M23 family metallopeptidase [Leptospiraceae bacterium]
MKNWVLLILFFVFIFKIHADHGTQELDEIDIELQKYLQLLQQHDTDEEKLNQIFGSSTEVIKNGIVFYNISEAELGEKINSLQRKTELYRIKEGDTLFSIAKRHQMNLQEIIELNPNLKEKSSIFVGDEIKVYTLEDNPNKDSFWRNKEDVQIIEKKYKVKKGDTLTKIAKENRVDLKRIKELNKLVGDKIKPGDVLILDRYKLIQQYRIRNLFIMPVDGYITSHFGSRVNPFVHKMRSFHKGIDIAAEMGTPIRAARDGIVIFSGRMEGYGNSIFIRHQNQYITIYAHNKVNYVKVGEVVRQGQIIGEVGRTGYATGPHLHFEIRKWDKPINPLTLLNKEERIPISTQKVALK